MNQYWGFGWPVEIALPLMGFFLYLGVGLICYVIIDGIMERNKR